MSFLNIDGITAEFRRKTKPEYKEHKEYNEYKEHKEYNEHKEYKEHKEYDEYRMTYLVFAFPLTVV